MWNFTNRHSSRRRGFSLIELLIVIAIILIIVTVALPKLNNATRYAHETAALKAIQTIHTMQVQYNSQYGHYATSLTEMGPPASGAATASAADLIDSGLAGGEKSGYKFTMTGNQGGYQISAVPTVYGNTGSRTFYSDQSMVIRENDGPEPATASSKEMK
jgi:type IV pilus assembly protein PilA